MKHILYFGTTPPANTSEIAYTHLPLIRIAFRGIDSPPIREAFAALPLSTHVLLTSKNAVDFFCLHAPFYAGKYIVIGSSTEKALLKQGKLALIRAKKETSEGVIEAIKELDRPSVHFFWPHSALSRPVIPKALSALGFRLSSIAVYDTHFLEPAFQPNFDAFDALFFTSPSTVDAFIHFFGPLRCIPAPLKAIGPITLNYIQRKTY